MHDISFAVSVLQVMRVSRADMPEGQLQPLLAGDDSSCKVAEDEPKGMR